MRYQLVASFSKEQIAKLGILEPVIDRDLIKARMNEFREQGIVRTYRMSKDHIRAIVDNRDAISDKETRNLNIVFDYFIKLNFVYSVKTSAPDYERSTDSYRRRLEDGYHGPLPKCGLRH